MEGRQLALQHHMVVGRAGDVARAAGASAGLVESLMHGRQHGRMLPHAEIVVGGPDGDLAADVVVEGLGESAGAALEIREDAIAPFGPEAVESRLEKLLMIHGFASRLLHEIYMKPELFIRSPFHPSHQTRTRPRRKELLHNFRVLQLSKVVNV